VTLRKPGALSGPVQVIPPGLLGFLQIKSLGENPDALNTEYQPTIEVFPWLMEARAVDWTQDRGGGTPAGVALATGLTGARAFSPNALVVPSNEMWWVEEYTINAVIAVGDAAYFSCGLINPRLGVVNQYMLGDPSTIFDAGIALSAYARARGFFAPPGSELVILVSANDTATTVAYTGYVRFTPLPV